MAEPKIDFSKLKCFPQIEKPNNNKIITEAFIESAYQVVDSIESFGMLFTPIVKDMRGNVKRLEAKYKENDQKFNYLEDLILYDKDGKENTFDAVTEGLLWLKRALEMIEMFFRNMLNDATCSDNVKHHLKKAYEDALLPYHGFLAQKGFQELIFIIVLFILSCYDVNARAVRRSCGKYLADRISDICKARGGYTQLNPLAYQQQIHHRTKRGVVEECCKQSCTDITLIQYCVENNNSLEEPAMPVLNQNESKSTTHQPMEKIAAPVQFTTKFPVNTMPIEVGTVGPEFSKMNEKYFVNRRKQYFHY